MKKSFIFLAIGILASTLILAQPKKNNVEVLYFKATLACCKARACNTLEAEIKNIVEKNYPNGQVLFKQIKLDDAANKKLIEQYKAKSQTVIIVAKTKKKEYSKDVSDIIQTYIQNQNKALLEEQLKAKINELLKK